MDQAKSGWEFEATKKENTKLTKENTRLLSEVERLSSELSEQRSSASQMGFLGAAAGPFVDGLLKTSNLNRSPLGKLLASRESGQAALSAGQAGQDDAEASFEAVGAVQDVNPDVLEFARHLETTFSQAELDKIFPIIGMLETDKAIIGQLYQLVQQRQEKADNKTPNIIP